MPFYQTRLHYLQFVVAIGLFLSIAHSAFAETRPQLLQQYSQALNMSGYILNAETNMNRIYSRQMNDGLLPLPETPSDNSLIQIEGSLVPPLRSIYERPFLLNIR